MHLGQPAPAPPALSSCPELRRTRCWGPVATQGGPRFPAPPRPHQGWSAAAVGRLPFNRTLFPSRPSPCSCPLRSPRAGLAVGGPGVGGLLFPAQSPGLSGGLLQT